ncbi:MAG: TetR/AcrR family transcriptional regulator [Acidimicrobiales bacterium]
MAHKRSSSPKAIEAAPVVGRPRKFDDRTERRRLIEAAIRVMERNDYSEMSVGDVLAEAGLSTRAFYRHYDSKEALLETFLLDEAESVGQALGRVVAAADDPVSAVEAWLERFLDVFYEPRRARRAAMLAAAAARASGPSAEMMARMREIACRPLVEALREGHDAGVLRSPRPEADAYSIHSLVIASMDAADNGGVDRAGTKAHVMRYAWPALHLKH